MTRFSVEVLRVFTDDTGTGGNELGVVVSDATTGGIEQQIAADLGFSETVFVDHTDGPARRASIRIFTPTAELPVRGPSERRCGMVAGRTRYAGRRPVRAGG